MPKGPGPGLMHCARMLCDSIPSMPSKANGGLELYRKGSRCEPTSESTTSNQIVGGRLQDENTHTRALLPGFSSSALVIISTDERPMLVLAHGRHPAGASHSGALPAHLAFS